MKHIGSGFKKARKDTQIWLFLLVALLLGVSPNTFGATLVWDENPEPDIAGYRVHYAEVNQPAAEVDVGDVTSWPVNSLAPGRAYYFYVTAYNTSALESDPSEQVTYTVPSSAGVTVTWDRSPVSGVTGYNVYSGATGASQVVRDAGNSATLSLTNVVAGQQNYYFVAPYNSARQEVERYAQVASSAASVHVPRTPTPTGNGFVGYDYSVGGNWKGKFGSEAVVLAGLNVSWSTGFRINVWGHNNHVWQNPSTDPSALQHAYTSGRAAAAWTNANYIDFRLWFEDTAVHRVAIYCLDYEGLGRSQRIQMFNSAGQAVSGTTISNFQEGVYALFDVQGAVTFRVQKLGPGSAVVSGIFSDLRTPPPIGTGFLGLDSSTMGAWKGKFGSAAYVLAGLNLNWSSGFRINVTGHNNHVWQNPSTDPSALQLPTSTTRAAAAWTNASSLDLTLHLPGSEIHNISVYCVDFDNRGRRQRIEMIDTFGRVLSATTISNFVDGVHVLFAAQGKVTFRLQRVAGPGVAVSGFFAHIGQNARIPGFVGYDTTTLGNWTGEYGSDSLVLCGQNVALSSGFAIRAWDHKNHVWQNPSSDTSALRKYNASGRAAAAWTNATSVTFRLDFEDEALREVAIYCLDFDGAGRAQQIDMYDATKRIATTTISNFENGAYAVFKARGPVFFRVQKIAGPSVAVSGIFSDLAP